MRFALWLDIINHCDINVLAFHNDWDTNYIINIYSDSNQMALQALWQNMTNIDNTTILTGEGLLGTSRVVSGLETKGRWMEGNGTAVLADWTAALGDMHCRKCRSETDIGVCKSRMHMTSIWLAALGDMHCRKSQSQTYFCVCKSRVHVTGTWLAAPGDVHYRKVSLRLTFVHKSRVHMTWHVTIALAVCTKVHLRLTFSAQC